MSSTVLTRFGFVRVHLDFVAAISPIEKYLFPCEFTEIQLFQCISIFRNTAIDVSTNFVKLDVTRTQGTYGRITVSYTTTMLAEKHTDNDFLINRAIESKDYVKTHGMLAFEPGQVRLNN